MTILDHLVRETNRHVPENLSQFIALRSIHHLGVDDLAFRFMRMARDTRPDEMFSLLRQAALRGGKPRDVAQEVLNIHDRLHDRISS
jgi:hypothetical protein